MLQDQLPYLMIGDEIFQCFSFRLKKIGWNGSMINCGMDQRQKL